MDPSGNWIEDHPTLPSIVPSQEDDRQTSARPDRNGVETGAFDGTQAVDDYCLCARYPYRFRQSWDRSRLGQRAGLAWRLGWTPRLLLAWRRVGLGSSRLGLAPSRLGMARGLGLGPSRLGLGSRLGLARRLGLGSRLGLDLALGCLRHPVATSVSNSCNCPDHRSGAIAASVRLRWPQDDLRPSSARSNAPGVSLLAGKKQGISSVLAFVIPIWHRKGLLDQSLTAKFPTHRNRELIGLLQGI